jgi:hypothetical protein
MLSMLFFAAAVLPFVFIVAVVLVVAIGLV